ncbi:unnamed protein product [Rotaria magnacalcarata]|uniref:Uncharacterized protein n=1 Tax=Rotaria magnacalcarata TaxID=392030 RepID=A0A816SPV6_9BILA|nr:unnamed protein product [Rotaria magnacalcarata]
MSIAIPTSNRQFYKILNDEDLLSQLLREQNLIQRHDQHKCHCGSLMTGGSRKKRLKGGTIKTYPTMRCVNRDCRNQINARKNTFFSYTDVLRRPNCKLDVSTIFEMIWLWCQEIPALRIAALVQVSQPTVVDWLNFLREVCQEAFNDATQMGGKRKYNRGRLLLGKLNNNNNNNNNNNVNVQNSSSSSDSESDNNNNAVQPNNNRNYGRRVEGNI